MFSKVFDIITWPVSKPSYVLCWFFGIAVFMIAAPSVLISDQVGTFEIVIDCDEICYEELGLAGTMPYEQGMKVFAMRQHISCEYLTLNGYEYDHIWQLGWTVEEKPGYWEVIEVFEWPIEEEFAAAGVPVREPKYSFEVGCRANHPDWVNLDERVYPDGKPSYLP